MSGKTVSTETRAKLSAARLGKRFKPVKMLDCQHCGKPFEGPRQLSIAAREKARFCSYDCTYGYRRAHPELSPVWRGGYDPYYGPNWKFQAKLARERDHNTCQDCGKEQYRPLLPVHHIQRLRAFRRDFTAANDLTNLITLCATCHMRRERALDFTS
jgi:hypothetical protein